MIKILLFDFGTIINTSDMPLDAIEDLHSKINGNSMVIIQGDIEVIDYRASNTPKESDVDNLMWTKERTMDALRK